MATRPNLVFVLFDDLGWRDLSCYGSSFYETPHMDRLATQAMRFTDAYAACPVCSPTRASLLTGKYPARLGLTDYIDWAGTAHPLRGRLVDAPYIHQLPLSEHTLASALRDGGYQTWHLGKWHLGDAEFYPEHHGFEVNFGGCHWGHPRDGYFSPWGIPTLEDGPEGEYLTDHLTDKAVDLIRSAGDEPFFLNLWHYAVHTPIQAPEELVRKYQAKARRLQLDQVPAFVEGEVHPTLQNRDRRVCRRILQSDPIYAAMMENLDWNIGRVLTALEETGQADNTLVIITSDNGGLSTIENAPTCNHPLAEGKAWMYEGGVREPLLVKWPGVVAPHSLCQTPVTSPDFYPTLLEAVGLPLLPEQHADGTSFLPLLRGESAPEREPLFWHFPHYGGAGGTPGCSIRLGDWKLIEFFEDSRLELYNLREDLSETRNLAEAHPTLTLELHERLVAWRDNLQALLPEPNPDWKETD